MLFIANNDKKEDILKKKGRYFSLLMKSFELSEKTIMIVFCTNS